MKPKISQAAAQTKSLFDAEEESLSAESTFSEKAHAVVQCGDALTVCSKLPKRFFRLIVSSPPYNLGKEYEKAVTLDDYLASQKELLTALSDLLADNGSIVWQVGNYVHRGEVYPLDICFYPLFKELGFHLRNRIVWHFEHGLHASKRFSGRYETLLWFTKSDDYLFHLDPVRVPSKYPGKRYYKGAKKGELSGNPLGKNPSDFWTFLQNEFDSSIIDIPNVKSNHPEKTEHPCQFPIELIERCVLAFTNEDDWVLDPFGGVGSSLIAALMHHRRGISIDREKRYCAIAKERLAAWNAGLLKHRPLGKPIHVPSGREKVAQRPKEWEEVGS